MIHGIVHVNPKHAPRYICELLDGHSLIMRDVTFLGLKNDLVLKFDAGYQMKCKHR